MTLALLGGMMETVVPALLVAAMIVGLLLWLLGWRLARPAVTVCGLVLGGLGGLALGQLLDDQGAVIIALVIGAGIAGALLAALLFRVWMGLSGAVLLALAAPAAVLIWQGAPTEASPEEQASTSQEAPAEAPEQAGDAGQDNGQAEGGDTTGQTARANATNQNDAPAATQTQPGAAGLMESLPAPVGLGFIDGLPEISEDTQEQIHAWYVELRTQVGDWWAQLDGDDRQLLFMAAGIGGLIGLLLGLVMPYTAAAVQSALVGALLLILPARELLSGSAEETMGWLFDTPRHMLLWLGLITLLGVLIQWTLFHKRADKK